MTVTCSQLLPCSLSRRRGIKPALLMRQVPWLFRQFWSQLEALENVMVESEEEAISRLSPKRSISCSSLAVSDHFSISNNSLLKLYHLSLLLETSVGTCYFPVKVDVG